MADVNRSVSCLRARLGHKTERALRTKKQIEDRFANGMALISEALMVLQEAEHGNVEKPIGPYSNGYFALRALIRDRTDPSDEQQLRAAAYAVYGWMPTILKNADNLLPLSRFIVNLRGASVVDGRKIVARIPVQELASLLFGVNNSVVGTSKLLHFLLPDLFPIDAAPVVMFAVKSCPKT